MTSWPVTLLGARRQPALLFLHGFMGAGQDWLPIAQPLSAKYLCVLPDLPGHGAHTGRALNAPLSFAGLVLELNHLLAELELARVTLVGYSMGGRLALAYAVKFPQQVAALVLEGASPGLANANDRQARAAQDDERAAQLLAHGLNQFVEQWYTLELFSSLRRQPALLAAVKARRKENNAPWLAKVIRQLSPGRQPPLWDKLGSLRLPVLLLAGALDTKYSVLAQKMAGKFNAARVAIVPEAGHNVHLEQPEQFTAALAAFLAQQQKLPGGN